VVQGLAQLQRSRIRAMLGTEIPVPVRAAGPGRWLAGPWLDGRTWCQLGYHVLAVVTGFAGALLAVLFPVLPGLAGRFTQADEGLARALLGPSRGEALALRVESLARSRADLVAAADAERRRIERDLHDGAQQRLVSLAMNLGMARERFDGESEPVRLAIAAAHDEAVLALTELREFIRGLHPAVLADHGLAAAVRTLAERSPVPVDVKADDARFPGEVETAVYFIVAEALANVAKHAHASKARVEVQRLNGEVIVDVSDDGIGGADVDGSGLRGLADRAGALDGRLVLASPPGAGTHLHVEIPCAS